MKLYKYKCSTCGKIWYEEEPLRGAYPVHGCPDGCDDAGEYLGELTVADITLPKSQAQG